VLQKLETVASLMGSLQALAPNFETNCDMTALPTANAESYVSDEERPET
jgi:hypothetical protein